VVAFAVTVKLLELHSKAAAFTALMAGKSFDKILTDPDPVNAQSACANDVANNATTAKTNVLSFTVFSSSLNFRV
jgi:hypothetical protein